VHGDHDLIGRYALDSALAAPEPIDAGLARDLRYLTQAEALEAAVLRPNVTPSSLMTTREAYLAVRGCDESVFVQDYSIELRLASRFDFTRVQRMIYRAPMAAPGRLSEDCVQTLHDVNFALALFLDENPLIDRRIRALAMKRMAGRTWHWARRVLGHGYGSMAFYRYLLTRMNLMPSGDSALAAPCDLFRAHAPIRFVGDSAVRAETERSRAAL
jgi:hypothetical protein